VVGFDEAISEDPKRVLIVLYIESYVRCEVQRGCGSLDEWLRSDSARVGIENDSTSAPLLRRVKNHDNTTVMSLLLRNYCYGKSSTCTCYIVECLDSDYVQSIPLCKYNT
jgi:hypothetical protein